jgi:AraC family transcriptional activator FtrA
MRENCRRQITIDELASRVAMSPRNFYRHFRAVTGHTPYDWLLRERVGIAMDLLEKGHLTLEQIADSSGFSSSDTLRLQFQKIVGIAPARYRGMFGPRQFEESKAASRLSDIRRVA